MSRPNPFELDQAHWDLIMTFIGLKAAEDGVVEPSKMVEMMRRYWLLLNDRRLLTAEVDAIELENVEAALVETQQAVIDQEQDIADRKARNGGSRTTTRPPPPPPPEEGESPFGEELNPDRVDLPPPEPGGRGNG